jgi:hypothetical protein
MGSRAGVASSAAGLADQGLVAARQLRHEVERLGVAAGVFEQQRA